MLAYSSVSQIGYIIFGFGIGSYLGFYGAIYHLLNHGISKAMMFFCCGALIYSFGTTNIQELGTKKHSRWMAICFFVGALGIGGMPPLNGFWSKFALYVAAAQAHLWWALGIALVTSLLTLAVLIRAGAQVFMQHTHADKADAHANEAKPALMMAVAADGPGARIMPGSSISGVAPDSASAPAIPVRRCPFAMTAVIMVMTLLVFLTGWNFGFLNNLIDLSVRALLGQMAGG